MVNLKINDISVTVDDNTTILNAAKKLDINIPTLCYLKKLNRNASCRMCLVEIKGNNKLVTSCSTRVTEGMEVYTDTDRLKLARVKNLELILSSHNKTCFSCTRNNSCKLKDLFNEYDIEENTKLPKFSNEKKLDNSSAYLVRDNSKCILCGRCVSVCKNVQGVAVIDKNKRGIETNIGCAFDMDIKDVPCIACGQCTLVCPTGALTYKDDTDSVMNAINDKEKIVIAITAPSVRVTLGEEFDLPYGTNVKGKMVASLRTLGFDKVFDVNFGADLTIMEESNELIKRYKNNGVLPMFTSCSPGWVKFLETYYPDMIDNLSTAKSPQQMIGTAIKTYYAQKNNIDPKNIFVVSVMPCIAKKFEIKRDDQNASSYPDVDEVITARELANLIRKNGIEFNNLEDSDYDHPLGCGASVIFGATGGVMESALRTFVETITNKPLDNIEFLKVRGLSGVKEASYMVDGEEIKVAVVSGIKNAKTVIEKIRNKEVNYHFVEFMTCPGGCINGGGQPIIDFEKYDWEYVKEKRMKAIISEDKNSPVRKAHENPNIIEIYNSYFGKPCEGKAEELLHTSYKKRDKYIR